MNWKAIAIVIAGALGVTAYMQRQQIIARVARTGEKWSKLHPEVQRRALDLIETMNAHLANDPDGLQVSLFDGHRDVADQLREIQEGDSFLSHPLNGYHPWGLAIDIVFLDRNGGWTWLPDPLGMDPHYWDPRWDLLGTVGEQLGFEWGGRWTQRDGPHFQLPIMRTAELRSVYGTPDNYLAETANA